MSNFIKDNMDENMIVTHMAENYELYMNAVTPPIFMNSLHICNSIEHYYDLPKNHFIYGRYGNPTVEIVEKKIAALESSSRAFLYASGMAAATAAVMGTCKAGDHIICVHNAYGPFQEFLNDYCRKELDINVTFVRGDVLEEMKDAIQNNTALIVLESPGTATFSLVDLAEVANIASQNGIKTFIDNTYCTPVFQKPIEFGIDIVMHSCTKYLGGHSDLIGGVLVTNDEETIAKLAKQRTWFGGIIGPMDAWLIMRGLRTLPIRMKQHSETAQLVAESLEKNEKIKRVYYPGLKSHPQYELAKKQQTGSSGLLSFEIDGTEEQAVNFVNHLKVFKIGPSWGGYESLVVMPLLKNTDEYVEWYGGSRGLIRIHCGLEGANVLLKDINQALKTI